ncbi:MAG: proline dehydrogenase family protein, partial [Microbacterium sp.]
MTKPQPPHDPESQLAQRAVDLAERWVHEAADARVDPAAARLAGVLQDPDGLPFALGFVDGVMRPESLTAAASNLHRVAPLVPQFLPWHLRSAVRVGGQVAPVLPAPTVPIARRVLRELVGHLIVDARPDKLGAALERLRAGGHRLNLNLLGEAVLGEDEARRRLDGIHDLIRRDDVDYVSVKVSAIAGRMSMWAFDEVVEKVVERLLPLYLTAASSRSSSGGEAAYRDTFINLDMEEYRDLDLTIAVFTRILEDPRLKDLEAGIVLQAYLPDALPALQELTAWATQRVDAGGARIKVRLVKGANLAMERVDAAMHGWAPATYASKLDTDANYVRCLDGALQPERTRAVRLGVAGHNLFDVAYAWLLAGSRDVASDVEFEMLLGMAQGQVEAVAREVGGVLLYVPVVRPDEFDVAISYLVRRLDENASSDNFLSAAFGLADDPALFERERDRFLASLRRAADPALPIGPRRRQDRGVSAAPETPPAPPALSRPAPETDTGLTQAVLGIARSAAATDGAQDTVPVAPGAAAVLFGGQEFVETAVYAIQESRAAAGAPGFDNTADSDPALAANRAWARGILDRVAASTAGDAALGAAHVGDEAALDAIVERVRDAAAHWGALPAADRAA